MEAQNNPISESCLFMRSCTVPIREYSRYFDRSEYRLKFIYQKLFNLFDIQLTLNLGGTIV